MSICSGCGCDCWLLVVVVLIFPDRGFLSLSLSLSLSSAQELMDDKYATLMKTNNFNRSREQKEAKLLRKSMHAITERMHTMMRRCEDAETANRNTIHGLSSIVSGLCKMDRTPFRLTLPGLVPLTKSELSSTMESELVVLELQDCSLGDKGALEVADALNTFVTEEAQRQKAVVDLRKRRNRVRMGKETKKETKEGHEGKEGDKKEDEKEEKKHQAGQMTISTTNDLDLIDRRRPPVRMSVNLSFNNITDANGSAVVRSLCRSIVATHCITELDLRGNSIGDAGMKMILDALQYNEGVRAVDLSGNYVEDADLLIYINSNKHIVGLPSLHMLWDDGAKERERVEIHDGLMELDRLSRLKRHGMTVPGSGSENRGFKNERKRPASAPITGRRRAAKEQVYGVGGGGGVDGRSGNSSGNTPQVTIEFPPKTSAVNAVQRVILDSITRKESHNPYRRTENVDGRGRQTLSGGGGGGGGGVGATSQTGGDNVAVRSASTPALTKSSSGKTTGKGSMAPGGLTPRGLYLQTMQPMSARSIRSQGSAQRGGGNDSKSSTTTTTIRSRLRLPPKRAESQALLRTPAGIGPDERKAKYHEEEKQMLAKRKEAQMLHEARTMSSGGSRVGSRVGSRSSSRVLSNDGGGDDHGDGEEESFYEDGEGGEEEKDEDDVSLVPRNGGQYAHEIFWPAFSLARKGKYADVTDWLDKGMEGDVREPETGQSLLMAAAVSNSDILIRMLLRKGGRVNGRCNKGWTPLHHCIASGSPYLYIADQLIGRGAKTEMRDNIGVTPLQFAVEQGSADAICRLIEAGASIKTTDDEGRTVLHRCAAREFLFSSHAHSSFNFFFFSWLIFRFCWLSLSSSSSLFSLTKYIINFFSLFYVSLLSSSWRH